MVKSATQGPGQGAHGVGAPRWDRVLAREKRHPVSLYEQLNLPKTQKMVSVVEKFSGDSNIVMSFKTHTAELGKVRVRPRTT